ncbi:MAG: hypothetical protein RJA47_1235 [Actinomycetota bacterium]
MNDIRSTFLGGLSHSVDPFQLKAMDALDDGSSVLVAAPTGSGKTLVAEYAIHRARAMRQRAFYTAPIKALSNQKYRDLCELHGAVNVGLVTGDNAHNPDAPIVVMTTEVLRNMIYASSNRLESLGAVVLDEVHFLQDAYRGPVWEEVIIQLDPTVQLVCLSATVSNADEVGQWLSTVRGHTEVVVETRRPVELLTHHSFFDSSNGRVAMHDTIVNGEPNRGLERMLAAARNVPQRGQNGKRPKRRFSTPTRPEIVELLEDHEMLPAIVFIFSRAQCEDAVKSCLSVGMVLTSREEEDRILQIVHEHVSTLSKSDLAALGYDDFLDQVGSGIACHHAGMIPMFKEAVEQCFVEGLIKVVFATETLAVGINMPARAVVIEKLTKYTGEHHVLLRASEYTQLTGRAGRRGLDKIGHAITLWNPFVTFEQTVGLALSRSFRLTSAFRPTYNMAVNMVRRHSREAATHFLNLSFAQFQTDADIVTSEAVLDRKRRELQRLEMTQPELTDSFVGSGEESVSEVEAEIALRALRPGDIVVFDASNIRGRAVVVSTAARRSGTRLSVLTPSRKQIDVSARDLLSIPVKSGSIDLPVPFEPARVEFVREAVARLVKVRIDESVVTPSVGHSGRARREVVDSSRSLKRLRKEIEQLETRSTQRSGSVTMRFLDVTDLLQELGYVDGWSLTERGQVLSGVFHESDLLVVEVLMSGILDKLSVPDLVACVSCLVFEPRGGASGYVRWPNDTVRNRFKRMDKLSQRLNDQQRARGIQQHRPPHAGFAMDAANWARGRPLADVLDPELTPGDFVRSMRQMIDLLRQLEKVSPNEDVRSTASLAVSAVNRGVVAAAAGEASA